MIKDARTLTLAVHPCFCIAYVIGRFIQSTMEELKIKISELKADMQELTNKVDDFSRYGRSPNDEERFEQISLLENWLQLGEQLKVCEELLETVQQNAL